MNSDKSEVMVSEREGKTRVKIMEWKGCTRLKSSCI